MRHEAPSTGAEAPIRSHVRSTRPSCAAVRAASPSAWTDRADGVAGRIGPAVLRTAAEWHEFGVAQEMAGDLREAIDSYREALLTGGPDAQVTFDLAAALAARGERAGAIERYRQTTEIDPGRLDAWVNLGDLLLSEGEPTRAVAALRRALQIDPADPHAHYNLAEALDSLGDHQAAVFHWRAFLRVGSAWGDRTAYAISRVAQG